MHRSKKKIERNQENKKMKTALRLLDEKRERIAKTKATQKGLTDPLLIKKVFF